MSIGSMNGMRRILACRASISATSSARRASSLQSLSSASRAASVSGLGRRDAPRQGAAYRPAHRNVSGRAGCCVTRPANALAFDLGQLSLGEIGQFQVVQEQVDKLVAAENEAERIFAVALARPPPLAAAR